MTVQVIATPSTDDGLQVQVFSRADGAAIDGAASPWRLHVSATALRDASRSPPARDIDALQRAASTQLPVASYYDRLAAQGAHYGPAFRGITSMARSDNGVLGRVTLDGTAAVEAASLLLHPALLDACFQLVGAGLPWAEAQHPPSDDICVPVGLSEYRVLRPGVTAAWCHVSIEPADADAEVFRADVALLDDAGAVVAEVRALELRRTTRASLQRALGKTDGARTGPTKSTGRCRRCRRRRMRSTRDAGWCLPMREASVPPCRSDSSRAVTAVVQVRAGTEFDTGGSTWRIDPRDPATIRSCARRGRTARFAPSEGSRVPLATRRSRPGRRLRRDVRPLTTVCWRAACISPRRWPRSTPGSGSSRAVRRRSPARFPIWRRRRHGAWRG